MHVKYFVAMNFQESMVENPSEGFVETSRAWVSGDDEVEVVCSRGKEEVEIEGGVAQHFRGHAIDPLKMVRHVGCWFLRLSRGNTLEILSPT